MATSTTLDSPFSCHPAQATGWVRLICPRLGPVMSPLTGICLIAWIATRMPHHIPQVRASGLADSDPGPAPQPTRIHAGSRSHDPAAGPRWPRHWSDWTTRPMHRWHAQGLSRVSIAIAVPPSSGVTLLPTAGQAVGPPPRGAEGQRPVDADAVEPGLAPCYPSRRYLIEHTFMGSFAAYWQVFRRSWCELLGRRVEPPIPRRAPTNPPSAAGMARVLPQVVRHEGADHVHTTQPHTITAVLLEASVGFDSKRQPT